GQRDWRQVQLEHGFPRSGISVIIVNYDSQHGYKEGRSSMTGEISIFDTTLRDGTQGEGISLSAEDKIKIARRLDKLGVHYIEGGNPGSNSKDIEFFKRAR